MTVFLKVPALLAASLMLAPQADANFVGDHSAIVKVDCLQGMGTAFRIGRHLLLSVKHVTSMSMCSIDGEQVRVIYSGEKQDFSMLEMQSEGQTLGIDCGGFVRGRRYLATGFARGLDETTTVELEGTGKTDGRLSVLKGTYTVIPGMSGGPIIDAETGKVVGTTNTYDYPDGLSGSVELRSTPVCHA
jgi:hypothetical protein